ncbi:hypothetical protein MTR67_008608 [Solanum verrucosum]|uniref:Uncharacterized protein n=1 Tax=Solanum verrucosum TaxID=315347 RepID=A0AAF0Q2B3_SOLVR|nr:hypothetical protein MTR67_008608 [Solanum verrucosum]
MSSTLVNILQVEVEFENSDVYILSAGYLKICSPAVDSTIRLVGGEKSSYNTQISPLLLCLWIRSYLGGDTWESYLLNLLELWGEVIKALVSSGWSLICFFWSFHLFGFILGYCSMTYIRLAFFVGLPLPSREQQNSKETWTKQESSQKKRDY